MGSSAKASARCLLGLLERPQTGPAAHRVLWALGEVGPYNEDRDAILEGLVDLGERWSGLSTYEVAVERLRLGPQPTRSALDNALAGNSAEKAAAARVLALGHPSGSYFLPLLLDMLPGVAGTAVAPQNPAWSDDHLVAISEAVASLQPNSPAGLEASAYLLMHEDPRVRTLAMARLSAESPTGLSWLRCWDLALQDNSRSVLREALASVDRHGDLSLLLVPRLRSLEESTYREIRAMTKPRLRALLEQLSPLARQMYELTTCPQVELREREEKLANDMMNAQDETATAALRSMPEFFRKYLGNDEVAQSAHRVMIRMQELARLRK